MPESEYLGPYKLGRLIGRGGMGSVFEGVHVKSGERVAIKLIAPHVSDDPRFRRRFDKEIRAMKLLKHPGIVRIIGEGEDERGRLFYSMELIQGETLQARIRRLGKIDWQSTIEIAIQVCSALKHAHDIGVTHRDIKPANLMITGDNQVKLVDLGIPKNYFEGVDDTHPGSVLGTPDYMAPEQASGGTITPRTDLYALGSVMYAMLAGRAPFKGKNATEVIESLKRDQPVPLDLVNMELPEPLVDLVHSLLAKAPEDRPPTALVTRKRLEAMRVGTSLPKVADPPNSESPNSDPPNSGANDRSSSETDSRDWTDTGVAADGSGRSHSTDFTPVSTEDQLRSTDDLPVASGPTDNTVVVRGPTRLASILAEQDAPTGVSESDRADLIGTGADQVPERPVPIAEKPDPPRARFETVDPNASGPVRPTESASPRQRIAGAAGILVMLAALAGIGYLFYEAIQPPTADEVFASIEQTDSRKLMEVFLLRFPDDPRVREVADRRDEKRLSAALWQIGLKNVRPAASLSPAAEGFVQAMQNRETDPAESIARIDDWIKTFGSAESPDPRDDKWADWVSLAQSTKERLGRRLENSGRDVDP